MPKSAEDTFGKKLARLREREGLSLDELAGQLNMKPAYLAKLERDQILPPVAEIITIARHLSIEPSAFISSGPSEASPERRQKEMAKRTRDYAYKKLSSEQLSGHLMAFQVTIDPESEHRKVSYHHPGEEFIFVIAGRLKISVGRKTSNLKHGQSIHFDSNQRHVLKNPGKDPTRLLVVLFNP